jgi:Excalibur calcium-binding domain
MPASENVGRRPSTVRRLRVGAEVAGEGRSGVPEKLARSLNGAAIAWSGSLRVDLFFIARQVFGSRPDRVHRERETRSWIPWPTRPPSYHQSMPTTYMTPGLERWRRRTDGPLLVVAIGSLPLLLLEFARNDLPLSDRRFLDVANVLVLAAFMADYIVELYDRLLRYLDLGNGVDANLAMIVSGQAVARFDSRDGYGRHEREDAYIGADDGGQLPCDVPAPVAVTPAPVTTNSAPAVSAVPATAVPVVAQPPASVSYANCDAVRAAGADPIRVGDPGFQPKFDRDGDGVGCE